MARLLIFVVRSLETAGKDIVRKATLFHSFTLDDCSSRKYPGWGISKPPISKESVRLTMKLG